MAIVREPGIVHSLPGKNFGECVCYLTKEVFPKIETYGFDACSIHDLRRIATQLTITEGPSEMTLDSQISVLIESTTEDVEEDVAENDSSKCCFFLCGISRNACRNWRDESILLSRVVLHSQKRGYPKKGKAFPPEGMARLLIQVSLKVRFFQSL